MSFDVYKPDPKIMTQVKKKGKGILAQYYETTPEFLIRLVVVVEDDAEIDSILSALDDCFEKFENVARTISKETSNAWIIRNHIGLDNDKHPCTETILYDVYKACKTASNVPMKISAYYMREDPDFFHKAYGIKTRNVI